MAAVSRKLLRWLIRLATLLTLVSLVVFVTDLWYDFLPSVIQTRLTMHPPDPVVVDIQIRKCLKLSSCDGPTKSWLKLPKDLLLGESWTSHAYVYTKIINENELAGESVVLSVAHGMFNLNDPQAKLPEDVYDDISGLVEDTDHLEDRHMAYKQATLNGWSIANSKIGLWVKKGKHSPGAVVTGLKVLYGDDARCPLPRWRMCSNTLDLGSPELRPRLAFRIGRAEAMSVPKLKFSKEGKFKIAQIADLHMSTGFGTCDHPVPGVLNKALCRADALTIDLMEDVLEVEKPDLAVFTGDQIFATSAPDAETALLKAFSPVIKRQIPFSVVWGNHDNQGSFSNADLTEIVRQMPCAIMEHGPEDVPGDGNYVVTASPANSNYPALSMAFLDSHSKLGMRGSGYDFIKPEQHQFVRDQMEKIRAQLRDYPHVPLSMAFFHIPLPEYRDGTDRNVEKPLVRFGSQRESIIAPIHNSGTLQMLREQGFSVVSVGHDHANDFCQLQPPGVTDAAPENVWLCYGGGAGFGGYGGYPDDEGDYKRRIRIFDVDMNLPYIETWHRVQTMRLVQNKVRLVDSGVARYKNPEQTD